MKLIPFYKGYCVAGLGKMGILTLGYASLTQGYEYLTRSGSPVDQTESAPIMPEAISDLLEFGEGFAFRPENKSIFPM